MEDLQEEQIRPITQHFPSFLLDKKPPPPPPTRAEQRERLRKVYSRHYRLYKAAQERGDYEQELLGREVVTRLGKRLGLVNDLGHDQAMRIAESNAIKSGQMYDNDMARAFGLVKDDPETYPNRPYERTHRMPKYWNKLPVEKFPIGGVKKSRRRIAKSEEVRLLGRGLVEGEEDGSEGETANY